MHTVAGATHACHREYRRGAAGIKKFSGASIGAHIFKARATGLYFYPAAPDTLLLHKADPPRYQATKMEAVSRVDALLATARYRRLVTSAEWVGGVLHVWVGHTGFGLHADQVERFLRTLVADAKMPESYLLETHV
jgi:hypothetical protein